MKTFAYYVYKALLQEIALPASFTLKQKKVLT